MGYFDKYNKQREEGTYQAPQQNATWRNAEQAIQQENPELYDAVQNQRVVNMWNNYVDTQQRRYEEALKEATNGRGNRSYLREGMAEGSYQAGMAAANDQRTQAQKRIDSLLGVDSSKVTGKKTDWGEIIRGTAYKGADQFSTSMVGGLNWLFGGAAEEIHSLGIETINGIISGVNSLTGSNIKPVENKGNLLTNWYETLKETKAHNEKVFSANANTSKAAQIVDNFGTSFVAAVPMALEAAFMGFAPGVDAAARGLNLASPLLNNATTAGLQYVSGLQAAKGMNAAGMMARQSMSKMLQNPQFWSSYVQAIGDSSETAAESGMSPRDAAIYTMINSFFNAAIEVGGGDETLGGIQNFPMRLQQLEAEGGKKAVVEWFKDSVLGEGLEEVAQGIFERGAKAPVTGARIASLDPNDTEAIINPWTSAQEFTGGAVVGGLLGGGQIGIQNSMQTIQGNRAFEGDSQALLESAKKSGGETYARAIEQIEQSAKRDASGAVKLNWDQAAQLYDIIRNQGETGKYQEAVQQKQNGKLLTTVFSDAGIDLTEDEQASLIGLVNEGSAGVTERILGMRDAYKAGESGQKLADVMLEMEGRGLTYNQISRAWAAGANVQTDMTGPVDVNTEEGRATLEANLAPLGTHIDAAVNAYDGKQDAARYSAAMQKAAFLYAANGADLAQIVQDARDGKVADIVGYLTDEQVKIAQDIGNEQRAQIREAEQTAAARTQELQEQAAAITKGQTVTAQALAEMDTAIDVANKASQRAVDTINQTVANLEAMAKANPKAAQTEAYKKAYDAAMQQKKKIEGLQKTVTELRRRKAELEGRKTIQRKKGTVSYSGGTVDGVKYDGVDQTKLTRQQQKVVAMVERLADAVNLDYVFISADPGMGGAYVKGGTVYVNINAGLGVGSFSQTMAAASLSHELTHWMQEYAPEQYRELKDFIVSEILKADPQELNRLVQQQQRWEKGRSLSYEQALDEVVANACQTMLLDSKAINKLARQNMNLAERIKDFIEDWSNKIKEAFAEVDTSKGAIYDSLRAVEGSLDRIQELWDEGIEAAAQSYNAEQTVRAASGEASVASAEASSEASTEIGSYDLKDFEAAKDTDGKPLFQVFAFEHDEPEYRNMLLKWGGMSNTEIDNLFRTVDMAMAKIKKNLEALDYAWEEDIDDRAFQPIKQNSDKLYKVSQDFSTLCRKRLLQGIIAGHLSASLQRGLTKEEGIAVRDALIALQEEGKQIEVACALCYVESARMRSQKAIQEFLNDREGALRNYYANQRGRDAVARAEATERNAIYEEELARNPEGNGLIRGKGDDATMYDVRDAKKAKMSKLPTNLKKRIQDAKKAARQSYALTEQQQKTVDVANSLPVESFTTPEGLQELAKSEYRDIFNAFVLKVSAASKSKGIENDTWWRAGDSKNVGDALIAQMNAENGLRTQSWSDFTVKHLMDYIAATIEMSTRGAKQHAYTKVIDYVELMGRTGVMINMSLIPTREFNGTLAYDDVEGFKYKEALRLRYKFPETAGTICIGMEVEQIRQLLESTVIDYVIPYHQSGMSKDTRKAMHIPAWKDFQNYQGEKQLSGRAAEENARKYGVQLLSESDPLWHEGPNFSDWFDLQRAQQIAKEAGTSGKYGVMTGGYMAMQDAAERYKQICAERGLLPKFSYGDADFSNDPNYWKLLIDRKMVNNVTGGIIEQKAIKPIFKSSTVRRILNDELKRYGTVKADQEEAIERVTRAFLTGDVKGGMSSDEIAKAMQKPVDNVPIVNITQNAAQMQSWDDMSAEEQEQTIQENKAFNKGQTKTGSPLRTLKGSDISRGGTINKIRYPVGKVISSRLYIHKDYIGTAIKANPEFGTVLRNAENALRDKYPDFEYNCISYHPASGEILFQEAPGFDTEREPMVGMQVKVTADGTVSDMKPVTQIWHHKWQWVDNDYDGFDVRESWEWSKQWLSTIVGASKGGSLNAWNGQLKENGLPTNEPIRFQLLPVEPVQPSSDAWQRSLTEPEALKIYSDMWDTSKAKQTETEEEKRKRDSTQRANTLATYGRIYDILKREGFTGKILDASSGLGLGTQLGRTEYGFDVTDIEPYPDPKYKPMFTDYSTHFGQYDAIISSAVLNVVAQDQRDALVVKMGQLLKTGGKMYVTTRTTKDDVDNLAKSGKNIPLGPHEFVETVHNHYQKGFTNPELKAYLQDALGDEFVAEIATGKNKFNNNTAVIVTKVGKGGSGQTQMQSWDGVEEEAAKHFGTTEDFRTAGYIMTDGRMLDFSGAHWLEGYDDNYIADWRKKNDIRQVDHEDIYEAFESMDDANAPSDAALTFMKRGNIRIVPELPGLELSAGKEPTAAQYRQIKEYVRTVAADSNRYNSERFAVDFTKDRRNRAGALKYAGNINADRVVNDIKHYYQTGEIRDAGLSAFYQKWDNTAADRLDREANDRQHNAWAPTFYSKLENTVNEWTNGKGQPLGTKMAAGQVVGWLRGKGVKAEEIRWSGIVPWLEGKKTVTKDELLQVMAENQINIETKVLGSKVVKPSYYYEGMDPRDGSEHEFSDVDELFDYIDELAEDMGLEKGTLTGEPDPFTGWVHVKNKDTGEVITTVQLRDPVIEDNTRWGEYAHNGGLNYREILFKMPSLGGYSNKAMRVHWDEKDVIAHARIQDMAGRSADGSEQRMLYVDEIQSDLHNEGASGGFQNPEYETPEWKEYRKLRDIADSSFTGFYEMTDEHKKRLRELERKLIPSLVRFEKAEDNYRDLSRKAVKLSNELYGRFLNAATSSDLDKNTKRVFAWATSDSIKRWLLGTEPGPISGLGEYGEDLEIQQSAEYFMTNLLTDDEVDLMVDTRKARAELDNARDAYNHDRREKSKKPTPDVPFSGSSDTYHEYVMKHLLRMAAEGDYDSLAWTTADLQAERWSDSYYEGYKIEYDQNIPKFMRKYVKQWGATVEQMEIPAEFGTNVVWGVRLNDAMKQSVLTEGQPLFQRWDNTDGDNAAERNGREQSYARLQSENKILSNTIKGLNKLIAKKDTTIGQLQDRLKLNKTPEVREADAKKLARQLLREHNSIADFESVAAEIKALGDYLVQTKEVSEDEVKSRARSIAAEILENATEKYRMEDEQLDTVRGEIKGKKLTISPDFLGELDQAGGYDLFRRQNFGKFTLARADSKNINRDDYMSVSQFYADMQNQYGKTYFPDAANEGEEAIILASVMQAADPIEVNPYRQYMGEATEELANRITQDALNGILRLEPDRYADAEYLKEKSRNEALNARVKQLVEENALSKEEAAKLWQQVHDLNTQLEHADMQYRALMNAAEDRIWQVRAEGIVREVMTKAKERERAAEKIQALKDHYKELQQNAKERRDESAGATKYRKQVFEKAKQLREMLLKNDDKTHVPEVLKAPLAAFLESLDFTSTRALRGGAETNADRAFAANLQKIQQILANQQDYINGGDMQQDLGGYIDVSPDSMEFLRRVSEMITTALSDNREYTINQMSAAELKDLSNFLSNLRTAIKGMNYFMANARFESVREAASKDIQTIQELGRVGTTENGKLFHAAAWENGTPYYIFRRFGEGGKAIFESLTRGWEKMALNVKEIMDFTEKAYTDKEVREWQKETHAITLEDGSEITMTTAQIMELSMLLNREQAVKHLSKGGMRIGDIEGKKGTTTDTRHHHLTDADIKGIVGLLTPRQAEVAKALQHFMAVKGAEWGNEISMRRFGYRFYTEGANYYPIKTDSNDRPMSDTDAQQNSMFRLLNLSASKSLNPKASNALIVGDIFDTFANHTSDMAKLNGMGLPILDAIKWFNFKERIDLDDGGYNTRTMQGAMEEAFGKQALSYFRTLMKDINGVTESGDRGTGFWSKLLSNYKAAAVGANLRVAFLQPTSYVRASYLIKPKYLLQAFTNKNAYKEAMENSGTAVWKSLGYYDTNIARGMRDQIKHNEGWRDKVVEKSMALAELGDKRTWGRLWVACKMQAAAETGKTGNELIQATADLFREVIYSSQVMDSTLTRSELMRGKSQYTKALTAFMAEPTLSYNMVMDAGMEYHMNARKYGKGEAWKRSRGYITKAISVYVCSAAFSAVVESIADAFRDDDDEEDFFIKWSQAMFGEGNFLSGNLAQDLSLFGKLPYIKNLMSALQGYKNKDMSTAALDSILDTYKIWKETIDLATGELDKPTKTTYYGNMTTWGKIYKTLQGISQLSGIAVANLTRDVTALWNTTVGAMYPEYKVKTYDAGPKKAIQDAYTAGRMSEEEAIQKLLESGTVEDEDKAYWTVRDWEGEDKYSQFKEAALNGDADTVKQELEQLTAHGVKEKTAISNLKSFLKKAYTGEELDKAESKILGDRQLTDSDVQKILTQFGGMDDNEAYLTVKGWETGDSGKYIAAQRAAFTGDQAAFKAEMQDLASHGVKEKDVRSAVKGFVRDAFMGKELSEEQSEIVGDHQLTEAEARKMLHYYAGLSVDDANKAVAEWKEDMRIAEKYGAEYEKYDLTTAQAKYFYEGDAHGKVTLGEYAKQLESYGMDRVKAYYGTDGWRQTGLTMDQYDKYATEAAKCKGVDNDGDGKADANSVKSQKLVIINSLPVSTAVKDAIYRKNNWAESGLKNTPWH